MGVCIHYFFCRGPRRQIPDPNAFIVAAADQILPRGMEHHTFHPVIMALEQHQAAIIPHIPDSYDLVPASRRNELGVPASFFLLSALVLRSKQQGRGLSVCERNSFHYILMSCQYDHRLRDFESPDYHSFVVGAAGEIGPV